VLGFGLFLGDLAFFFVLLNLLLPHETASQIGVVEGVAVVRVAHEIVIKRGFLFLL